VRLIKQEWEREAAYPLLLEIAEFEKLMCKIARVWHGFALCKLYGKRHTAQSKQQEKKKR